MKVKISELPLIVQQQLPFSIRSLRNEYELEELPPREREIIKNYIEKVVDVNYKTVYDLRPAISKFADFYILTSVKETVVEYLKNYFYTLPGDYPFDPTHGCRLKLHLQTKDTQLRKVLINEEIRNVIGNLSADLGLPITVKSVKMSPSVSSTMTEYTCAIEISIPGEDDLNISLTSTL